MKLTVVYHHWYVDHHGEPHGRIRSISEDDNLVKRLVAHKDGSMTIYYNSGNTRLVPVHQIKQVIGEPNDDDTDNLGDSGSPRVAGEV